MWTYITLWLDVLDDYYECKGCMVVLHGGASNCRTKQSTHDCMIIGSRHVLAQTDKADRHAYWQCPKHSSGMHAMFTQRVWDSARQIQWRLISQSRTYQQILHLSLSGHQLLTIHVQWTLTHSSTFRSTSVHITEMFIIIMWVYIYNIITSLWCIEVQHDMTSVLWSQVGVWGLNNRW